jgi:hypothetical protein
MLPGCEFCVCVHRWCKGRMVDKVKEGFCCLLISECVVDK